MTDVIPRQCGHFRGQGLFPQAMHQGTFLLSFLHHPQLSLNMGQANGFIRLQTRPQTPPHPPIGPQIARTGFVQHQKLPPMQDKTMDEFGGHEKRGCVGEEKPASWGRPIIFLKDIEISLFIISLSNDN